MFQDISLEELHALRNRHELTVIDVRSESEFADSTIPGSVNIPLFTDEERAEVGTLYKQTSIQAAKQRGLEIVSAKLPAFIRQFGEIKGKKAVFCWRGGMRSRTTATVLSLMDIHAYRLVGGFRTYRKWVIETLENCEMPQEAYVLHGHTGTGKTALLKKLSEAGQAVLDLEELAGHRGSIFGEAGLKPRNQKTFEALLLEELLRLKDQPFFFFEAESKRIGRVVLPEFLVKKKLEGTPVQLVLPLEARIQQILHDYEPAVYKEHYIKAFHQVKRRIHTPVAAEIESSLLEDQFENAIRLLLIHYYDPRYTYSEEQYETQSKEVRIEAPSVEEAFVQIMDKLNLKQGTA
ncbi:tRNA 2-selenouridine(34) synthase MnmH [Paenibacillus kobensis]|uniref:tRNA 2-selenouridine(34) synthase MnmH n=1 Tax=Paenibacillus kobensis TaxID=59841 RepID=UPI000FD90C5E|nr:tRNA 2-selenouridine(34) synthase MnmH [Paenibacillus kobensis]